MFLISVGLHLHCRGKKWRQKILVAGIRSRDMREFGSGPPGLLVPLWGPFESWPKILMSTLFCVTQAEFNTTVYRKWWESGLFIFKKKNPLYSILLRFGYIPHLLLVLLKMSCMDFFLQFINFLLHGKEGFGMVYRMGPHLSNQLHLTPPFKAKSDPKIIKCVLGDDIYLIKGAKHCKLPRSPNDGASGCWVKSRLLGRVIQIVPLVKPLKALCTVDLYDRLFSFQRGFHVESF